MLCYSKKMTKPELISPAGDLEKLKIAFKYGADAVYASTPSFSMRTREIGFDNETLRQGIKYAHSIGKKVYLTINTFPHSSEITKITKHIDKTIKLNPDAIIAADPGVVAHIRSKTDIPIHLSTQANTTNYLSAGFWQKQGVKRIILARELNIKDIEMISNNCVNIRHSNNLPSIPGLELESFVHGAMCMAYSGRCQISNYFSGRDPNKGACVQACRFKYRLYDVKEEMRPGEKFQIYEDKNGSYIFNSKDLNMIGHIPELIKAGISSFKIEGRLKSTYYLAVVTRAYRQAIDQYFENKSVYRKNINKYQIELNKISNRGYTTGFYFEKPDSTVNNYKTSRAKSTWDVVGVVEKYSNNIANIKVKNNINVGDNVELLTPDKIYKFTVEKLTANKNNISIAHPNQIIEIPDLPSVSTYSFLRKKINP